MRLGRMDLSYPFVPAALAGTVPDFEASRSKTRPHVLFEVSPPLGECKLSRITASKGTLAAARRGYALRLVRHRIPRRRGGRALMLRTSVGRRSVPAEAWPPP